ncbi:MAG: hypothetical protein KDD01_15645 [Phaeodactylibacter sp.]|nr:hypothetical protein [Phaeodactylibacter sp.]
MAFTKGTSGNPDGRPPGKNKISRAAKETLLSFVADYIDGGQAQQDWEKMKPRDRWQIIHKLAGILIPRETVQKVNWNNDEIMTDEQLEAEIERLRKVVDG